MEKDNKKVWNCSVPISKLWGVDIQKAAWYIVYSRQRFLSLCWEATDTMMTSNPIAVSLGDVFIPRTASCRVGIIVFLMGLPATVCVIACRISVLPRPPAQHAQHEYTNFFWTYKGNIDLFHFAHQKNILEFGWIRKTPYLCIKYTV